MSLKARLFKRGAVGDPNRWLRLEMSGEPQGRINVHIPSDVIAAN